MIRTLVSTALAAVLLSPAAFGQTANQKMLSPAFAALQRYETKSNAVSDRSNNPIEIEHYEIPLGYVKTDMSLQIDPQIASALVFEKNGQKYLRWMINPEDTVWHLKVAELMQKKGVPVVKGKYFIGYQTASRSYILRDPNSGVEFSAKVSTNKTGGNWADKKQSWEDAWQVRMAYAYVHEAIKQHGPLKHALIIDEPAAFGLEDIDQGMLIRTYDSLKSQTTRLVPGFSVLHEQTGRDIAQNNGTNDPATFWNEHYNKALARAIAELTAVTGMTYDSPHSQNFLVELDQFGKPTGRIALRDLGDSYMTRDVFEAAGKTSITDRWEQPNVLKGYLHVAVGFLHGNLDPSWLSSIKSGTTTNSYDQWGRDFFSSFEAEFKNVTGVDLSKQNVANSRRVKYFVKDYPLTSVGGPEYLDWIRRGRPQQHSANSCQAVFHQAI